uniref:hypothetical protein n=1 Tax=Salmonella enterica TaxID=28901 RepID=UPI003299E2BC
GRPRLLRALSAAIDGETISVAEVSPTVAGTLVREEGWPCGSEIELTYEHGWPVPPKEVVRAAVKLAREFVLVDPSIFDQRAGRI